MQWSWQTVVMGVGFLVFLLTTRHIVSTLFLLCLTTALRFLSFNILGLIGQSMRKPKLFWVSAAAPLASVIVSTLIVFCLQSKAHGISVVRAFEYMHIVCVSLVVKAAEK